jgi:hypothetical protein
MKRIHIAFSFQQSAVSSKKKKINIGERIVLSFSLFLVALIALKVDR